MTAETDAPAPLSPYHSGMLTLLTKLADAAIQENVWDEDPPALWCVDYTRSAIGDTSLAAASLAAWEMPLRRQVWDGFDPVEVLRLLAEHLEPVMRQRRDHGLGAARRVDAVALCGEAWTLDVPADATEDQIEQAQLFARARGEADHPWGVEAKTVMAVGADGWRYHINRHRKSGEGPAIAIPPGGGIGGRYPVVLAALLAAMRARP